MRKLLLASILLLISGTAYAATNGISADHSKGVVLLGSPAGVANCKAATTGAIRYNSTTSKVESCNGTSWSSVGGSVTPAGSDKQVQWNNNGSLAASSGLTFNSTTDALTLAGTTGLAAPTGTTYAVLTADFTDGSGVTTLQAITGLSFTLPASVAQNIPFQCKLMYSQATHVSDSFGIGLVTYAPTRIDASGTMTYAVGAPLTATMGVLTNLTTTTPTLIVTATPAVNSTVYPVDLSGTVQNASNAGTNTLNFYVSQATAADVVIVKAGSWCKIW